MGQFTGEVLDLFEMTVKPFFQLRQWNVRNVTAVKVLEWKGELGAKLVEGHLRHTRLLENVVRRPPHRREIVHQRPGPVENDVTDHEPSLLPAPCPATHKPPGSTNCEPLVSRASICHGASWTSVRAAPGPSRPDIRNHIQLVLAPPFA